MRDLVERTLGIPAVQATLPQWIAGATLATEDEKGTQYRGIVLNVAGDNTNVWVRRATLAHELGHLLFDPEQHLESVKVDSYLSNKTDPEGTPTDFVEQRANAFAIAFLAPLDAVREMVPTPIEIESVAKVMRTFGISRTAAHYHVVNAHYRNFPVPGGTIAEEPSDDQKGKENFTTDYFQPETTPLLRRGRFAGLVVASYDRGLITDQTAALYLGCSVDEFLQHAGFIRDVHPV